MSHSFLQRNSLFAPISFLSDLIHNDTEEAEVRGKSRGTRDGTYFGRDTNICLCPSRYGTGNFWRVGTDGGNATRLFKNVKVKDSSFLIQLARIYV